MYTVVGLVGSFTFLYLLYSGEMAKHLLVTLISTACLFDHTQAQAQLPGAPSFVVPSAFPTSVFSSYYLKPAATSEPQPALYDPILNITYPLNLTDPTTIPTAADDPVYYPQAIGNLNDTTPEVLDQNALYEIKNIIYNDTGLTSNCSKCIAALSVGKTLAQKVPSHVPDALVSLCQATGFATNTTC